jgi:2-keto-4-pentenoate hydratase/2-oxohepta-3-ene-1,7-dioic acid hydratase in catechol pathway
MKIICVGRNYVDHAKELNNPVPESPVIFLKPQTALLSGNKPFYHPDFSQNIHHEIEVVLKVKKNGKSVNQKFAPDYYDEIGLGIDFTARDLQDNLKAKGQPWELAKAFDNSAVIGNFVQKSEINLENISFNLRKNKTIVQQGETRDLIFNFDYLISYISNFFTLQMGDLIYTGTPAGVGKIEIGDQLIGSLEGRELFQCVIK